MKIIHIIGILISLTLLADTALAADIVLDTDNEGGAAVKMQNVVVSVSGNVATFSVSPKEMPTGGYYPQGWFVTVGLPEGATVADTDAVRDKNRNPINGYSVDTTGNIDGFKEDGVKIIFTTTTLPNPGLNQELYTTVYVTFGGTFKDTKTQDFGAHVAWGQDINGINSAKFMKTVSVPEFQSLAAPIAAIIGLMFIMQRRKEN